MATRTVSPPLPHPVGQRWEGQGDREHEGEEQERVKMTPLDGAPPMSFADKYTDIMEKNLDFLPDNADDSAGKRTVKAIARILITIIVFPLFTIAGTFYNIGCGIAKAVVGVFIIIAPNTESLREFTSENCFKEAFKHLCFGIIDGLSWVFSCLVSGAYGFAPRQVDKLYDDVEDEINSGKMYDFISSWTKKLTRSKDELYEGQRHGSGDDLDAYPLTTMGPTLDAIGAADLHRGGGRR